MNARTPATGAGPGHGAFYLDGPRDFDLPDDVAWLNTAHQGPLPRRAAEAAKRALGWKSDPTRLADESFFDVPERLRSTLARLVGGRPDEIVIGNSASHGLHVLALGLGLGEGDEVLVVEGDFPATIVPWLPLQDRGVRLRRLPDRSSLSSGEVVRHLAPETRVLCVTWVDSFSGHVLDLEALGRTCADHDVLLIVNATQGLGVRPLRVDELDVHAVTCAGYKWLCGPYGTGFAWISPELLATLEQPRRYWLPAARTRGLHELARLDACPRDGTARGHDVCCTASFNNVLPWIASLDYLLEIGIDRLAAHNRALVECVRGVLGESGCRIVRVEGGEPPPLLFFAPRDGHDAEAFGARLKTEGIHVSVREGLLRVSPHVHNHPDDVERLRDALVR